jgi:GNAT superfamily N-acetyltransferase
MPEYNYFSPQEEPTPLEYFWEDLNKSSRRIGDVNPVNPNQVWDTMSNGVDAWRKSDQHGQSDDNFIKNAWPSLMAKSPKTSHPALLNLKNHVLSDSDRHFIPTQRDINAPAHYVRARHLISLLSQRPDVNLSHDKDKVTLKVHRHPPTGKKFTSIWEYSPNGIKYGQEEGHTDFKIPVATPDSLPEVNQKPVERVSTGVMVRRAANKSENDAEGSDLSILSRRLGKRDRKSTEPLYSFLETEGDSVRSSRIPLDSMAKPISKQGAGSSDLQEDKASDGSLLGLRKSDGYQIHFKGSHKDGSNFIENTPHDFIDLFLANLMNTSVYATKDGHIVGHVQLSTGNNDLVPIATKVKKEHQRKGLATAMIQEAERQTGKKITRSTNESPDGAAFYSKVVKAEYLEKAPLDSGGINFSLSTIMGYAKQHLPILGEEGRNNHIVKSLGVLPDAKRDMYGNIQDSPLNGKEVFHHIINKPNGNGAFHFLSSSPDFNQERPVAGMLVEDYDKSKPPSVALSSSDYSGYGFGKRLYQEAVKHHGSLQSDGFTSPSANKTWQKLSDNPDIDTSLGEAGKYDSRHVAIYNPKKLAANELSGNSEQLSKAPPLSYDEANLAESWSEHPHKDKRDEFHKLMMHPSHKEDRAKMIKGLSKDAKVKKVNDQWHIQLYRGMGEGEHPDDYKSEARSYTHDPKVAKKFANEYGGSVVKQWIPLQHISYSYSHGHEVGGHNNTANPNDKEVIVGPLHNYKKSLQKTERYEVLRKFKDNSVCSMFMFEGVDHPDVLHVTHKYFSDSLSNSDKEQVLGILKDYFKKNPFEPIKTVFDKIEYFGEDKDIKVLRPKNSKLFLNDLKDKLDGIVVDKFPEYKPHVTVNDNMNKVDIPIIDYILIDSGDIVFRASDMNKSEPLMKPWVSEAQRKWGNSPAGHAALGDEGVAHWNKESKNKKVPEKLDKGQNGDWTKEGYKISHTELPTHLLQSGKKGIRVQSHDKAGNLVGYADILTGRTNSTAHKVDVDLKHRRKGLATAMYRHAERHTGTKMIPSSDRTDNGKALWRHGKKTWGNTNFGKSESSYITGQPITINYLRNKEKAGNFGTRYGQHIEPHGEYMIEGSDHNPNLVNYEKGSISFKNPLVIPLESAQHPMNHEANSWGWKSQLANQYGKTGKDLSNHLKQLGHDAIITTDKYGSSEIVNLGGAKNNTIHKSESADKETEIIKENELKPEAKVKHKFKAAEWTHPNGHPRCFICGQEERTGGYCEPLSKSESSLLNLKSLLESPKEIEHIDMPEKLAIQWSIPQHRWGK